MKIAKFKKNVAKAVAFTCAAATLVSVSPNVYADGCVPNSYPDDIHFNLHFDSFGNNSTIYEEVTRFATWDSYKGIIGRPYGTPTIVKGINGSAVLVSPGSYVDITGYYVNRFAISNSVSIAFWMKPDYPDNELESVVFDRSNVRISITNENKLSAKFIPQGCENVDDSLLTAVSEHEIENGVWSYVTVTADNESNQVSIYINGKLDGSFTLDVDKKFVFADDYYGAFTFGTSASNGFNGLIDEASIYGKALDEREALDLYYNELSNATEWEEPEFPTAAAAQFDTEKAFESENVFLLNEDFEKNASLWRDETLSNVSHSGKLALKINYKANTEVVEYYPIKKTLPFSISEDEPAENTGASGSAENSALSEISSDFTVSVAGKGQYLFSDVTVEPEPDAEIGGNVTDIDEEVMAYDNVNASDITSDISDIYDVEEGAVASEVLLNDGEGVLVGVRTGTLKTMKLTVAGKHGEIFTDEYKISDRKGNIIFNAELEEGQEYLVYLSDNETTSVSALTINADGTAEIAELPKLYSANAKINQAELWIRPGDNARHIEFYAATDNYGYDSIERMYVKLLCDKNGDGMFAIGEDFELNSWQKITLDLTKTDEVLGGNVVGIYMTANDDSDWYIDDITSSYNKIETKAADLSALAADNIIYENGSVKFASDTANTGKYLIDPQILRSDIYVNGHVRSLKTDVGFGTLSRRSYSYPGGLYSESSIYLSKSGNLIVYSDDSKNKRYIKNIGTEREDGMLPGTAAITGSSVFSENGEYYASGSAYYHYKNGEFVVSSLGTNCTALDISNDGVIFYTKKKSTNDFEFHATDGSIELTNSSDYQAYVYPDSSKLIVTDKNNTYYFKKRNGKYILEYQENKVRDISDKSMIDEKNHRLYSGKSYFDLDLRVSVDLSIPNNVVCMDGDKVVFKSGISNSRYIVYDLITNEQNIFYMPYNDAVAFRYDSEKELLYCFEPSLIGVCDVRPIDETVKFMIAFDGGAWYSYNNGWREICKGRLPSVKEYRDFGMTFSNVNSIPSSAFEELSRKSAVNMMNFAVYFSSASDLYTPNLNELSVNSTPTLEYSAYAVRVNNFAKADYSAINGIYASEDFSSNAETNYFFYIGDEWIYSYKNGRLIRVPGDSEYLFAEPDKRESQLRRFGMSRRELSAVPSEVLSNLLINPEYGNSNFGVVTVVRTDRSTKDFNTDIVLNSTRKYTTGDTAGVQITMTDGTVISLSSGTVGVKEIDRLISWIENRQNNIGPVFYTIKTSEKTYFINYYMISSISIN